MTCSVAGFPKLTVLSLEFLPNLVKWTVEEGSMPVLSKLCIVSCLEELLEGLIFLSSLRTLILDSMPSEFCDKLRTINVEQGADIFKVAHVPSLAIVNPDFLRGFFE